MSIVQLAMLEGRFLDVLAGEAVPKISLSAGLADKGKDLIET